jgi:hypothetical protein
MITHGSLLLVTAGLAVGCGPRTGGAQRPTRMIVLGDGIVACSNVGGKAAPDCSVKVLADYLSASYAPAMKYENAAVAGAVTADVPAGQLPMVKTGGGHVLVLVYVGGQDVAPPLLLPEATAQTLLTAEMPKMTAAWDRVVTFFEDKTRFPDGSTLIMNSQFDPFDDCTAAPYFVSPKKIELLHDYNDMLQSIAFRAAAELTDQFNPFLGHGHHYNDPRCPHFQAGAEPWMGDLILPNAAGHKNLYRQWKRVVDQLYR